MKRCPQRIGAPGVNRKGSLVGFLLPVAAALTTLSSNSDAARGQSLATFDEVWTVFVPNRSGEGTDLTAPETVAFDESHSQSYTWGDYQWTNTLNSNGWARTWAGKRPGAQVLASVSATGPTDIAGGTSLAGRAIARATTRYDVDVRPLPGVTETRIVPINVRGRGESAASISGFGGAESVCSLTVRIPLPGGGFQEHVDHTADCKEVLFGWSCTNVPKPSVYVRYRVNVSVSQERWARLNVILTCRSEVLAEVWNNQDTGHATATGTIDPVFYVDPAWEFATDYELFYSRNGIEPAGLPGDWDGDYDVDILDFAAFSNCLSGPNAGETVDPPEIACLDAFDDDTDGDVDLFDFGVFQSDFIGPLR